MKREKKGSLVYEEIMDALDEIDFDSDDIEKIYGFNELDIDIKDEENDPNNLILLKKILWIFLFLMVLGLMTLSECI